MSRISAGIRKAQREVVGAGFVNPLGSITGPAHHATPPLMPNQWIDEAISNYLALLFADTRGNPEHTLRVWLSRYRRQLTEKSPDADEPAAEIGPLTLGVRLNSSKSPSAYERVVYGKGSWIIHML